MGPREAHRHIARVRVPHTVAFGAEKLEEGWWPESKVLLGMRDIPFGRNIDSRDVDGLQGRCHARPAVRTDCRPSTTGCADLHGADSPAKGYAAVTVRARPKGRARHRVTREAVPPIAVTRPRV